MKESSTYQAILDEGFILQTRKLLRRWGDRAFGPPDAQTAARIEQIDDLARLEELADRVPTAKSWQELLGEPAPKPRSRRRRSP
jgi:hypothetical protein